MIIALVNKGVSWNKWKCAYDKHKNTNNSWKDEYISNNGRTSE